MLGGRNIGTKSFIIYEGLNKHLRANPKLGF
jgi:hypothetical protein